MEPRGEKRGEAYPEQCSSRELVPSAPAAVTVGCIPLAFTGCLQGTAKQLLFEGLTVLIPVLVLLVASVLEI